MLSQAYLSYAWLGMSISVAIFVWFVWLEQNNRRDVVVWLILGEAILEALLYPNQGSIPSRLFYMPFAGRHIRPSELFLALGLMARLVASKRFQRWTTAGAALAAFGAWYTTEFAIGVLSHNPLIIALFDIKEFLLFIVGTYVLAAGVPARQLVGPKSVGRWVLALCAAAVLLLPFAHGLRLHFNLPLVPLSTLGYGADATDCAVALGGMFLALELYRSPPRPWVIGGSIIVVASSLAGTQRAAMLVTGGVVGGLVLAMLLRRRNSLLPGATSFRRAGALLAGIVALVGSVLAEIGATTRIFQEVHAALFSTAKAQSASARIQIWTEASHLFFSRPFFGWGLGTQVPLRQVWPMPVITVPSHDLVLDLLMRGGIVALGLFVFAMALFAREGIRTWRGAHDPMVAGLALGALAGLAGLASLAVVESLFDQVRIAITFGFLLGCLTAASRQHRADEAEGQQAQMLLGEPPSQKPLGALSV